MKKTKKQPKVAIIILTCNQKKLMEETISSVIKKTNYKNYRIFLIDNGSEDRHDLLVREKFPEIDVTRNKKNLGFSKANNIGIKKSSKWYNPSYFLLLNDDMEINDKDWLKKMILVGENEKNAGIIGCQLLYPDGTLQNVGGYLEKWRLTNITKFKKDEILDVDHFMGACILIKKEVVERIGVLDEIFTPFLLEDSDYFLRAKKAGYSVKIVTSAKMIHKKSKTVGTFSNRKHMFSRFKNDIVFSLRHMKTKDFLFRIFIYLPMVSLFKKKKDLDKLEFKNFKIRKRVIENIFLLFGAYLFNALLVKRIFQKRINSNRYKKSEQRDI